MIIRAKKIIKLITFAASVLISVSVSSAAALAQQTQANCEQPLREYIRVSDFNTAYVCATKILETNPSDIDGQLVLARAAQELGQPEVAAQYARSARQLPLNRSETYASYLISGLAEANLNHTMLAKYYLRRAANLAKNPSELALIANAMNFTRGQSPWSVSISANIDPSSNINDGSLHDTYDTIFGPGTLSEDAQAQAGIGFNLDLSASYQRVLSDRTLFEAEIYSHNTLYSGSARNDYTLGVRSTLTYIQAAEIPVRWVASIAYEQRYLGDALGGPVFAEFSPYHNQTLLVLERRWQPRENRVWSAYGSYTLRNYDGAGGIYSEILRVGASYSFPLRSNIGASISGYAEQTDSVSSRFINKAGGLTFGINWDLLESPFSLSGKLSYVHTEYEFASDLAVAPRLENKIVLDLGVTPRRIQWFGFRPTFGVELIRNFSNNNRFDTFSASAYTKIQSVF